MIKKKMHKQHLDIAPFHTRSEKNALLFQDLTGSFIEVRGSVWPKGWALTFLLALQRLDLTIIPISPVDRSYPE